MPWRINEPGQVFSYTDFTYPSRNQPQPPNPPNPPNPQPPTPPPMSFSPNDVLLIVLSFCVLWISAAMFWLIWQLAQILRNVNVAVDEARENMGKIEIAITGIKNRFENMTAPAGILVEGIKKLIEYGLEKRAGRKASRDE